MLQKSNSPFYRILKLGALIPIIAITIGYNATAQTAPAEPEEPQILKVNNNSQTDYPKLSEFVYGNIDYEVGLTKKEIELHQNRKQFSDDFDSKEFRAYMNSDEYLTVLKIGAIRNANAVTVVMDDKNDNRLLEIREYGGSPSLHTTKEHFKNGMSNHEYRAILREIERDKPLSEFETSEEMYQMILKHLVNEAIVESRKEVKIVSETEIRSKKIEEIVTEQVQKEKVIPFAVIYKVPSLENCTGTNDEVKKCITTEITKHVNENFNTGVISKENKGRHMITVQFKINKEGKVVDISAKSKFPELTQEAFRVVESLPTFIPGELENGEKVGVIYGLPIVFQI
jgi:hypothetical protein